MRADESPVCGVVRFAVCRLPTGTLPLDGGSYEDLERLGRNYDHARFSPTGADPNDPLSKSYQIGPNPRFCADRNLVFFTTRPRPFAGVWS